MSLIERTRQWMDDRALSREMRRTGHTVVREVGRSFFTALSQLNFPATLRARRPYRNHPWVYAAVRAIATNISQAPFNVVRETPENIAQRDVRSKGLSKNCRGRQRMARQRFLTTRYRKQTGMIRGVEIDESHPLQAVLASPNPFQTGQQLWDLTVLWLLLSGEALWWQLPEGDGADMIAPGDTPGMIIPVDSNSIEPEFQDGQFDGWRISQSGSTGRDIRPGGKRGSTLVAPHEIIQFKFTDPNDFLRGLAPITAAAAGISIDMLYAAHNRSVLENGSTPGGILVSQRKLGPDQDVEKQFLEKWDQRHKGENRRNRVAILSGIWSYIQTGMTQKDMDYIEGKKLNREEILAVFGIPKGIVSVTDDLNFAIAQTQERAFVDRTLFPLWRMFEDTLDSTLFAPLTDDVMGAFDLSGIEALRLGLGEKIVQASTLCAPAIHMPPSLALQIVGIDSPAYPASDIALVSPILAPVEEVAGFDAPAEPPAPSDPEEPVEDQERSVGKDRTDRKRRHWAALRDAVLDPGEALWSTVWRRWVRAEKKITLKHFDDTVEEQGLRYADPMPATKQDEPSNVTAIDILIPDLADSANRLTASSRPTLAEIAESAYDFTRDVDLQGIVVLEFDDPVIQAFMEEYQRRLAGTAPKTIQESLRRSLRAGVENGETLAQLRARVAQVYDISASDAKTLQVARTETGSISNGIRQEIFVAQGFDEFEWSTAQDEFVRDSHNIFGGSGKHMTGFNYLTLTTNDGTLEHPHDARAPAREVINCRCTLIVF